MKKCRIYDRRLKIIRDVKYIDFANEEVMYYADEFEQELRIGRKIYED